jgi:non-specific serine/threonine protein kinase
MIGKNILHYKILAKLGEGGMGVVYKARDTKLDRDVAIKFLPHHIAANAEERERFKIEAQAAAALNHPNIATIYAIEEVDGELFIVMEFIDGKELREIIKSAIPNLQSAIEYATQIASGLQAAHAKGITHRDIKSSNILVTESSQVKIMDFGLAKIAGGAQLTKDHSTLGTAAYMSPEQARGEPVDQRTDIWAFGVVLYEMLTGQLPFRGEYEAAVMYSILNEEPEYGREIAPDLKSVLQKALAKEVEQRYQQASDLLDDLKAIDGGKESKFTTKIPKRQQGNRVYLFAGAAILVMVVLAAIFWWPSKPGEQTIDSIAVLPLDNLSGDPAQEYFSDGMTEALITGLSKISALKVISRTSAMQYKGARKPLPEIAKELGVKAVIEGSVMRDGDRVRITAQLIEAETDRHLWADSYERNLTDVFALQRDIAQAIAGQVKVTLTPGEQKRLQEVQQIDPRAYEAYLKGIHHVIQVACI